MHNRRFHQSKLFVNLLSRILRKFLSLFIQENETRVVQEQRAKQRAKQRAEQKAATLKRKESMHKSPMRSTSAPAGKEASSIVDRLLGNIRDGFTGKHHNVETDGTTTDSDYGSRPTSPAQNAESRGVVDDSPQTFVRGIAARRSFQKVSSLNAISEYSNQVRDDSAVNFRRVSRGSQNDMNKEDTLTSLLLNEEEPLAQPFKREGSVRRSSRKRRTTQYSMTDSRERAESPVTCVQDQDLHLSVPKPHRTSLQNAEELIKVDNPETHSGPRSPLKRSFRSKTIDIPETSHALSSVSRRDEHNITSPVDQTMYRNVKSDGETSRPVSMTSDDGSVSSEVAEALADKAESVCDDIHRDRIARYAHLDNTPDEAEKRLSGDSKTFKPIQSHEDSSDRRYDSPVESVPSDRVDQLNNVGKVANKIQALTQNLNTLESHDHVEQKNRENSERSTNASVDTAVNGNDGNDNEGRLSEWKNNVQNMNIEEAVNTVESSVYDRNETRKEDHSHNLEADNPPERPESEYRARLRRWKTMRSESVIQEPPVNVEQLTEERRRSKSFQDSKPSEAFKDTPLTPHLALAAMETESVEERYRDKIIRDRLVLESIMGLTTAAVAPIDVSLKEKEEPTTPTMRPVGLKALKVTSSRICNCSFILYFSLYRVAQTKCNDFDR